MKAIIIAIVYKLFGGDKNMKEGTKVEVREKVGRGTHRYELRINKLRVK